MKQTADTVITKEVLGAEARKRVHLKAFGREISRNKALYSMMIPGIILLLLFNYFPMFGLVVAFKNFNFTDGIFGSPWSQPLNENFKYLFSTTSSAIQVTVNTLFLNSLFIIFSVVVEVAMALMFNELVGKRFKKVTQTLMTLPYFISWIVVGVIAYNIFNVSNGVLNSALSSIGAAKYDWYANPGPWPAIMVVIYLWKFVGYGMILYLAALAGVDPTYYEAAKIDGASRWDMVKHISLPALAPTIIILVLLHVGKIMNADFGMFYAIVGDNAALFPTVDVLDTFVFRSLRLNGDIGMASACGFYQSIISFILILLCNKAAKRINPESGLF
jgi:putative aldouronate transport system permease protein